MSTRIIAEDVDDVPSGVILERQAAADDIIGTYTKAAEEAYSGIIAGRELPDAPADRYRLWQAASGWSHVQGLRAVIAYAREAPAHSVVPNEVAA